MTELHYLLAVAIMTSMFFLPYTLVNIGVRGLPRVLGNPHPDDKPLPAWALRAKSAHANAVENLVVFAVVVIAAHLLGATSPATLFAAKLYFIARAVHYLAYTLGVPGVRTLGYFVGWGAMVFIGLKALGVL